MDNKREEIGKIMLYACIGTSAIIVICNIIVLMLDDSEMALTTAAWLSTVFWSVIVKCLGTISNPKSSLCTFESPTKPMSLFGGMNIR